MKQRTLPSIKKNIIFFISIILLSIFRIWIIQQKEIVAVVPTPHDMGLYVSNAESLISGNWFGPYNERILARGLIYPFFIAGAYLSHIPITIIQTLLYLAAAFLFLIILKSVVRPFWMLLPLYALIIFNPFTIDQETSFEMTRAGIYLPLILGVISSLYGVIVYVQTSIQKAVIYSGIFGIYFFLFWYHREESFFMLPTVGIAYGYSIWNLIQKHLFRTYHIIICSIPIVIFLLGTHIISSINAQQYGIYTMRQFDYPGYANAYNALFRIHPDERIPYIAIPKSTRFLLYAVSPSFAKLKPFFEGEGGYNCAVNSFVWTHIPPEQREIAGGAFYFCLRSAVWELTQPSQEKEQRFFENIAKEITLACKTKYLNCGLLSMNGFSLFAKEDFTIFYDQWVNVIQTGVLANKLDLSSSPNYSDGQADQIALFRKMTNNTVLVPGDPIRNTPWLLPIIVNNIRIFYQQWMPITILLTIIIFIIRIISQRVVTITDWFQSSLLLSATLFYISIALFGSLDSPTNTTANSYTSGGYVCIIVFVVLEMVTFISHALSVFTTWKHRSRDKFLK